MTELSKVDNRRDVADLLSKIFEKTRGMRHSGERMRPLQADWMETPIGPVFFGGDDEKLHLLGFVTEETGMLRKIALLEKKLNVDLELGEAKAVSHAKRELTEYFTGERRDFETPLALTGTAFQIRVWEALQAIPYGETASYAQLAERIGSPSSFRAVAQANSQNPIAIIVPCHRVVNTDGGQGGYAGGVDAKTQLLEFEQKMLAASR